MSVHMDKGVLLESVSGAQGGQTRFLDPGKLDGIANNYLALADEASSAYNILDTDTSPGISYAYDNDGEAIDD